MLDIDAERKVNDPTAAMSGAFLGREKQFVGSNLKSGIDDGAS